MSLATLKIFSALLVKFERGAMSLRSVQFVRTVKLLTVRQEEFTVRKLHVISDNKNIFDFAGKVRERFKVFTVRTFRKPATSFSGLFPLKLLPC